MEEYSSLQHDAEGYEAVPTQVLGKLMLNLFLPL
jgi:hypothetical protein